MHPCTMLILFSRKFGVGVVVISQSNSYVNRRANGIREARSNYGKAMPEFSTCWAINVPWCAIAIANTIETSPDMFDGRWMRVHGSSMPGAGLNAMRKSMIGWVSTQFRSIESRLRVYQAINKSPHPPFVDSRTNHVRKLQTTACPHHA